MKKLKVILIGEPNTGKSSFLNQILNKKVSIVSPLIQTTQKEIFGLYKDDKYEILFTDTPGLNLTYKETEKIGKKAIRDGDLVIFFFSVDRSIKEHILNQAIFCKKKKIAIITKVDKKKSKSLLLASKIKDIFSDIFYTSIKRQEGFDKVLHFLKELAIESNEDFLDINNKKEQIEELVREVVYNKFYQEVPYEANFILDYIEDNKIFFIIEVPSRHRKIYLSKVKEISMAARLSINKELKTQMHFFLKFKFIK